MLCHDSIVETALTQRYLNMVCVYRRRFSRVFVYSWSCFTSDSLSAIAISDYRQGDKSHQTIPGTHSRSTKVRQVGYRLRLNH